MKALLFDAYSCVGCEMCSEACVEANGLPEDAEPGLSAARWTSLEDHDGTYLRQMCMHCVEPSCASACPVGALVKTDDGPVTYDFAKCIGCRYCMVACPFKVPRYTWDSLTPRVSKCQMCPERLAKGQPTACAEACEFDATVFGDRTEMIAEAWRRISEYPDDYAHQVYGLEEAGGTCVFVIGPKELMETAFDPRVPTEALPEKTWVVLSKIPTAVGVAGASLVGLNWLIRRRMRLMNDDENLGEER